IWPEHLGSKAFLEGVDQAQLAADYQALTGRPLPVPAPTPPPAPTPAPDEPTADDVAFAHVMTGAEHGTPWIAEHHIGANGRVAAAAKVWLAAKQLLGD